MEQSHRLVHDVKQVDRFCELFFTAKKNQTHVYQVLVRDKWDEQIKQQRLLKRGSRALAKELVASSVEFVNHLTNRELVPEQFKTCTAVYFTINPRNCKHATEAFINKHTSVAFAKHDYDYTNVLRDLESVIRKSPGETYFVEFDIDTVDAKILDRIKTELEQYRIGFVAAVRTRNGYHVIYDKRKLKKLTKKLLAFDKEPYAFKQLNRNGDEVTDYYISMKADPFCPVPGTIQGGFKVHFDDQFI